MGLWDTLLFKHSWKSMVKNTSLKVEMYMAYSGFTNESNFVFLLQDSATLLAEIVNSCTKPSESPAEVWEKLLCPERKI